MDKVNKLTDLIKSDNYRIDAFNVVMDAVYDRKDDDIASFFINEDDKDYLKQEAARCYFEIEDKSTEDIFHWLDWQLDKCNQPVEGQDGNYLNVTFDSVSFKVNNRIYTINNNSVYGSNDIPIDDIKIINRIVRDLETIKRVII